ncbi:DUF2306 domain-containing protein [Nonomuraea antimicrobica]
MRNDDAKTTTAPPTGRRRDRAGWLVPTGLIALAFVPVLAGAVRLTELAGLDGAAAADARFAAAPVPIAVHIVTATVYSLVGAFQFSPRLRRRRLGWHRAAGRVVAGCGLAAALSGVWMTLFSDIPPGDEGLAAVFRLVFGSAMFAFVVLGLAAVRRRDIRRHRAWMIRAYAIGLGAGTQALTQGVWFAAYGPPDAFTRALLMGAGWAINVAVAEWVIRRGRRRRSARHPFRLVGPHGDLDPVADAELGHQARDVALDRAQ